MHRGWLMSQQLKLVLKLVYLDELTLSESPSLGLSIVHEYCAVGGGR